VAKHHTDFIAVFRVNRQIDGITVARYGDVDVFIAIIARRQHDSDFFSVHGWPPVPVIRSTEPSMPSTLAGRRQACVAPYPDHCEYP